MDGQLVDNSVSSASPAPAAPKPAATPPTPPAPEASQAQIAAPAQRDPAVLSAILEGADPATLFGGQPEQPPAAATLPQAAAQQPPANTGQGPEVVEVPDKFKNPDGTINSDALLKSYVGLEKVLGDQGNKLGQYERQLQEAAQFIQAVQRMEVQAPPGQQGQPPTAPPQEEVPKFPWEVEMTPEEREAALEEFYADPLEAQAKRDQQTIMAMEYRMQKTLENVLKPLAPIVEKQQYEAEVNNYAAQLQNFAQAHPDVQEILPAMQVIAQAMGSSAIKAMEANRENPLDAIYAAAKALHRPAPPPPPTPEQLIADPNYRQKIVTDPNIKNEILKSTITGIKDGQPPPVIGSQVGVPPATPSEKPKSAREATSMLSRMLLRS
jgi:hypothetical protein